MEPPTLIAATDSVWVNCNNFVPGSETSNGNPSTYDGPIKPQTPVLALKCYQGVSQRIANESQKPGSLTIMILFLAGSIHRPEIRDVPTGRNPDRIAD